MPHSSAAVPYQTAASAGGRAEPQAESAIFDAIQDATLLIVDDEAMNIMMLRDMLQQAGYHRIHSTLDSTEVVDLYRELSPDLLLLDLMMPKLDGIGVMEQLRTVYGGRIEVPILVLTADASPQTKRRTLAKGAKDFLHKPFDAVELLLRIENLLETRFLYRNLQLQNETLEGRVHERTGELELARQRIAAYALDLEEAQSETLERLARAGEFRDDDTGQHTYRVGRTSALLAAELGFSSAQVRWLQQAARLHDVGKIGISDLILLKPGKLTDDEFATMKTHTTIGAAMFEGGRSELIQIAGRIARSHHERWTGGGYPDNLSGEQIPIEARIVAVADVFDALTHERPYKLAWPIERAVAEIERQSGIQFDPQVVAAFMKLAHEILI